MIIRHVPLICLFAGLTACANVNPEHFRGPSGRDAYTMRCSQMGRTWAKCYTKAGELCPKGYNIIDQQPGMLTVPYGGSIIAVPKQTLVVECR